MLRRTFLRTIAISASGKVLLPPLLPMHTPVRATAKQLGLLARAESIAAEIDHAYHRPGQWKCLPARIKKCYVTTARAWRGYRGLSTSTYDDGDAYQAYRRPDEITGIPWREAREAVLRTIALQLDTIENADFKPNNDLTTRVIENRRRTLLETIRACERCIAAVRAELTTGTAPYRPAPDTRAVRIAEKAQQLAEIDKAVAEGEARKLRRQLQACEAAKTARVLASLARNLLG